MMNNSVLHKKSAKIQQFDYVIKRRFFRLFTRKEEVQ